MELMVNVKETKFGKISRMNFQKINEVLDMPNLIEVQKNSYKWFLEEGLKEVFDDKTKYSITECKARDATYAIPMRATVRLLNKETGEVKEQEVFMGEFPLMTDSGTFIINGAERVIVSQLVRSPGIYFGMEHDKSGKKLFSATVIPNRGAWLEYETGVSDISMSASIKREKFLLPYSLRLSVFPAESRLLMFSVRTFVFSKP